jgi:hypothetical protein
MPEPTKNSDEKITGSKGVKPNKKEGSFVRWQTVTMTQLGYAINLFLGFATASLGFILTLIKDKDFIPGYWGKMFLMSSLVLLLLSIILAICATINRLRDFRKTAAIARHREEWRPDGTLDQKRKEADSLGKCTWKLFWWQIGVFTFGIVALVTGFLCVYHAKLF